MRDDEVEPMDLMHADERNGPIEVDSPVERSELDAIRLCEYAEADGIVDHMGADPGTVWVSWLSAERKAIRKEPLK